MPNRLSVIAEWLLTLGMLLIASFVLFRLPATLQIVVHWDANGNPNGWMGAFSGLMLIPGTALVLTVVKYLRTRKTKSGECQVRGSSPAPARNLVLVLVVMLLAEILIAWNALGYAVDTALYVPLSLGALFIVLGATFKRLSFGVVIAVRTPVTLQRSYVDRQKDLPVRLVFVLCGIGIIFSGIFLTGTLRSSGLLIFAVVVPSIALILDFLRNRDSITRQ